MLLTVAGVWSATAEPGFDGVRGWDVLTWDMDLSAARAALEEAGREFDERFMMKDGTTRLNLDLEGWRVVVYFDHEDRPTQVLRRSPAFASAVAAGAARARLEARFGPPGGCREGDAPGVRGCWAWTNATTRLELTVSEHAEGWLAWEEYQPVGLDR